MLYALIKNGEVQNIIVAEPEFISVIAQHWDYIYPTSNTPGSVGIGWLYDGENFTPPASDAESEVSE